VRGPFWPAPTSWSSLRSFVHQRHGFWTAPEIRLGFFVSSSQHVTRWHRNALRAVSFCRQMGSRNSAAPIFPNIYPSAGKSSIPGPVPNRLGPNGGQPRPAKSRVLTKGRWRLIFIKAGHPGQRDSVPGNKTIETPGRSNWPGSKDLIEGDREGDFAMSDRLSSTAIPEMGRFWERRGGSRPGPCFLASRRGELNNHPWADAIWSDGRKWTLLKSAGP